MNRLDDKIETYNRILSRAFPGEIVGWALRYDGPLEDCGATVMEHEVHYIDPKSSEVVEYDAEEDYEGRINDAVYLGSQEFMQEVMDSDDYYCWGTCSK